MVERLLGTPTEEIWPGLKRLRDWHEYPQWKPENFARAVPNLSPIGLDLLSVCSFLPVKPMRFIILLNS